VSHKVQLDSVPKQSAQGDLQEEQVSLVDWKYPIPHAVRHFAVPVKRKL